jgi:hypothetical protein
VGTIALQRLVALLSSGISISVRLGKEILSLAWWLVSDLHFLTRLTVALAFSFALPVFPFLQKTP